MKITITRYYNLKETEYDNASPTQEREYLHEIVEFEGVTDLVDGKKYIKDYHIGDIEFNIIDEMHNII